MFPVPWVNWSAGWVMTKWTICGGTMDENRDWFRARRSKTRDFLAGRHRGAPVDYVMALAIVLVAMLVVVAGAI